MDSLKKFDRYLQKATFSKKAQILLLSDYVEVTRYVAPADFFKELYRYRKGAERMFASDALTELARGKPISDAAKYWFDSTLVKALEIGEKNGKIEETMPIALKTMGENTDGIAGSFVSLIKPTIYLGAAVAVMVLLKEKMLPAALRLVNNDVERLSDGMRNLLETTNWIIAYGYLIPIGIITTLLWFAQHLKNNVGPLRNKLDKLPIYKQYALFKGAQFIMNYSVMKELGEADKNIIATEYHTGSPYYQKHLKTFNDRLGGGKKDLDEILAGSLFDDEFLGRLRIISGTQSFNAALKSAASKTNQDIIKEVGQLIKGVSLIILAVVLSLAITIIQAIYSTG